MNLIRIDDLVFNIDHVTCIAPAQGNETAIFFTGGVEDYITVPYAFESVLDVLTIAGFTHIKTNP